jgi:hypothetical protein
MSADGGEAALTADAGCRSGAAPPKPAANRIQRERKRCCSCVDGCCTPLNAGWAPGCCRVTKPVTTLARIRRRRLKRCCEGWWRANGCQSVHEAVCGDCRAVVTPGQAVEAVSETAVLRDPCRSPNRTAAEVRLATKGRLQGASVMMSKLLKVILKA